ncbi:MAG: methyltransferase domain-containing protein, partial [Pirellula sp.]
MTNVWNSDVYEKNARFVSELGTPVVELLNPQVGERILDLGCGDGVLSAKLRELGCEIVGIDSSQDFVRSALDRGVDAQLGDARHLAFDHEFDAVFSNAVLHWIPESNSVATGV